MASTLSAEPRPKLHHTVPKHFTQPFAGEDGLLSVWRRQTGMVRRLAPAVAGARFEFHTVVVDGLKSSAIETAVTNVENLGRPHLVALRNGELDAEISAEAKIGLSRYFGLLWGRTPKIREMMNQVLKGGVLPAARLNDEAFAALVERTTLTASVDERLAWEQVLQPLRLGGEYSADHEGMVGLAAGAQVLSRGLQSMTWTIYRRKAQPFFISGSEPVTMFSRARAGTAPNAPWDEGTVIAVAVSPERLVFMDRSGKSDSSRTADFHYSDLRDQMRSWLGLDRREFEDPVAWWGNGMGNAGADELYARSIEDLRPVLRLAGFPLLEGHR